MRTLKILCGYSTQIIKCLPVLSLFFSFYAFSYNIQFRYYDKSTYEKTYEPTKKVRFLSYDYNRKENKIKPRYITYRIYHPLEFPLTVCMQNSYSYEITEQIIFSVDLWNKRYLMKKDEIAKKIGGALIMNGENGADYFQSVVPKSLFTLKHCFMVDNDFHIAFDISNIDDKNLGYQMNTLSSQCGTLEHIIGSLTLTPFYCVLFRSKMKSFIEIDSFREDNNSYHDPVLWENIRPSNKVRKITIRRFLYSTIAHELGHSLGLPHIPHSIMNGTNECEDTTSNYCVISDKLLFRFLDYYYPGSLSNVLSRAKRVRIRNKKTQNYRTCISSFYYGTLSIDCNKNDSTKLYFKAIEQACEENRKRCKTRHPQGEKIYNSNRSTSIYSGGCAGRCP